MPAKGVTKTGDAFCMSCGSGVDSSSSQCPACLSQLDSEVKAFACPRCRTVLEFGTSQCTRCGMKFKVKALKPPEDAKDEKLLSRLIEWGKPKRDDEPESAEMVSETSEPIVGAAESQGEETSAQREMLIAAAESLFKSREELLGRMNGRLEEARIRLAPSRGLDELPPADLLKAELDALVQDVSDLGKLEELISGFGRAVLSAGSDESMKNMLEGTDVLSNAASIADREKPISKADAQDDRDSQLVKREEMVNRKIKAYAAKKKQLDDWEAELRAKAESAGSQADDTGVDPETKSKLLEYERLRDSTSALLSAVLGDSAEFRAGDFTDLVHDVEVKYRDLKNDKDSVEARMSELTSSDDEVRRLLKVLDGLLGELPKEVIERFSASEDFALYEKVFDKLKI